MRSYLMGEFGGDFCDRLKIYQDDFYVLWKMHLVGMREVGNVVTGNSRRTITHLREGYG